MSKARIMPQETGFELSMSVGKWDLSRGTTALRNQAGKTSETLPGQNTLAKHIHKTEEIGRNVRKESENMKAQG